MLCVCVFGVLFFWNKQTNIKNAVSFKARIQSLRMWLWQLPVRSWGGGGRQIWNTKVNRNGCYIFFPYTLSFWNWFSPEGGKKQNLHFFFIFSLIQTYILSGKRSTRAQQLLSWKYNQASKHTFCYGNVVVVFVLSLGLQSRRCFTGCWWKSRWCSKTSKAGISMECEDISFV